jgi:hypothetical protein
MQSTNIRQIKAALVEQAFLGSTRVSCPIGPIVAVRRRKGQLLVMIRGWGRWCPVESVSIERMLMVHTWQTHTRPNCKSHNETGGSSRIILVDREKLSEEGR